MRRRLIKLMVRLIVIVSAGLIAFFVSRTVVHPLDTLNWLSGTGNSREADIAFGDLARQRLDVYRPSQPRQIPAPVVVFFYGGGWGSGERGDYRFVGQFLAARGFTVVIPDYRVGREGVFPAFLEDGAKALRWTQNHIAEHGGDPQRIFLMGHSAGAYNAVMLALDRRYGAAAGFDAKRIRGVVGLAGPYDFKLESDNLQRVFGAAADPRDTQPVNFAGPGAPPVLLITGDADDTVNPRNSQSLARHLEAAQSPVTLRILPEASHRGVLLRLSPWYPSSAVRDDIIRFLDDPVAPAP
jgi:acetyl esterase/lipase